MKTYKNRIHVWGAVIAAALVSLSSPAAFGGDGMVETPGMMESILINDRAEVAAIDYETREVTLVDELGKEVTIVAGETVERLAEIEVGDIVEFDYYMSVAAELRAPTEEELENPLQIVEEALRGDESGAPAGAVAQMVTAVCTVEGLDRPTQTITLMGPLGGLNVVQARDVENLTKMRIGDTVVVTFTQAFIVSLEEVEEIED